MMLGSTISERYSLRATLGAGGMGTVYRAFDNVMQREVAIKIFKNTFASSSKQAARAGTEAQALAALSHPNIVSVLASNFGTSDGHLLVMELVEGRTVAALVEDAGPMDAVRVTKLAVGAAEGLAHAHSKGIIHRDLKPQNFIVTNSDSGEERLVIMDFGIAKLMGVSEQRITQTGEIVGTPQYISPEQCTTGDVSERTDIYSFGCTLYFMLTGTPPFVGDSPLEVLMKHGEQMPDTSVISDGRLRDIVGKCMEKDPAHRFQSATELAQALGGSGEIRRENVPARLTISPKKLIPVAAAVLLITAGLAAFWSPEHKRAMTNEEASLTVTRLHGQSMGRAKITEREFAELEACGPYIGSAPSMRVFYEEECRFEAALLKNEPKHTEHAVKLAQAHFDNGSYSREVIRSCCNGLFKANRADEAVPILEREIARQYRSPKSDRHAQMEGRILEFELAHILENCPKRSEQLNALRLRLAADPLANEEMLKALQDSGAWLAERSRSLASATGMYYILLFSNQPRNYALETPSNMARARIIYARGEAYSKYEAALAEAQQAIDVASLGLDPKRKYSAHEREESRLALAEAQQCLHELKTEKDASKPAAQQFETKTKP